MSIYYAGIGSRETPVDVINKMVKLGTVLAKNGYTLRSGGADGADTAFEVGCSSVNGNMEIWVPWVGFNGRRNRLMLPTSTHVDIAKDNHPVWDKLPRPVRLLHSRNVGQILGEDLITPVSFVLCWTQDGAESSSDTSKRTGGTGMAIRVASKYNVPIVNMFNVGWLDKLKGLVGTL